MTDIGQLRIAINGLIGFTAMEEAMLLAAVPAGSAEPGSPECWAAIPLVAHNTEFKRQQVLRLDAIGRGETPPEFTEIDHRSDSIYRQLSRQPADQVIRSSREVTAALVDGLSALSDDDLLDPSRHSWLKGRQFWLQVIVRGFWHPMGHLGEYYNSHAQPGRAVAMQSQAVAAASYLNAPDPARGMAYYNLACAQAQAEFASDALASLRQGVALNPDLIANARRDADLAALRENGLLATVLAN
jgi:hypothetical protein